LDVWSFSKLESDSPNLVTGDKLFRNYRLVMQKRQAREEDTDADGGALKRAKFDPAYALVAVPQTSSALIATSSLDPGRTSSLMTPEVSLLGHEGAIYSLAFDPSGQHLCSGSFDKQIFLWDVFGECKNYNILSGHKNAVLQVAWPTSGSIVSCSADKTVACWDANKGVRLRKLVEHAAIVNSCAVAKDVPTSIVSGSDDCTVILWDARSKRSVASIYQDYQVCSVCISSNGQSIYAGGIDNTIRKFDTRMNSGSVEKNQFQKPEIEFDEPAITLQGHADTITGMALSPDEHYLLSNSMDGTLRCWDVRPFAAGEASGLSRCERISHGVHHGAEKLLLRCAWSPDQELVAAGSADRLVHSWDASNFQPLPCWPGHKASVNEVIFHPKEKIIASCGSDRQIILGELP